MSLDTQIALALTAPDTFDKVHKNIISITDKFVMDFAEWIENYTYHKKYNVWIKNDSLTVGKTTTKELLEIYKKEKGL